MSKHVASPIAQALTSLVVMTVPTHLGTALAGPNANTSIVLHAVETSFGTCNIADPCSSPAGPTISVTSGVPYAIYFIVRNYDNLTGLQFGTRWNQDWVHHFSLWDCQHVQHTDCGMGFPLVWSCIFDCITGGASAVIGRTQIVPGSGCMEIVETPFPGGNYAFSCTFQEDPIAPRNSGRVCVGAGGVSTCESVVPVEAVTWGRIRQSYQSQ